MLSLLQQENLVKLVDYEVGHFLCESVPKYQSFSNMHFKYFNNEEITVLIDEVLLQAYAIFEKNFRVNKCWFNIIKIDSPFEIFYHKHTGANLVCVYYLKNCTNNGTFVIVNDKEMRLSCLDNTLQFMSSNLMHSIPKFNGVERYSIAFDLLEE